MNFSLNEIDVHCKKAIRGAGFEWGHAEEAGRAIRWLAMYDLPGVGALASYLSDLESPGHEQAIVCPVLKGSEFCDRSSIDLAENFAVENLAYPILLLPYLAFIANKQQKSVSFLYDQTRFLFGDNQLDVTVQPSSICDWTQTAQITFNRNLITGNRRIDAEQNVDLKDWQLLNKFATRTYVPASEISRQGAGSDEDRI